MTSRFTNTLALLSALSSLGICDNRPKVLSIDMHRQHDSNLHKRSSLSVTVTNEVLWYYVNVTVGTPPQEVQLLIDTGSSDTWIHSPNACNPASQCTGGIYTPELSKSLKVIDQGKFRTSYAQANSGVTGDYIKDDFTINGVTVKSLTMGLATTAGLHIGILGLNFAIGESIANAGGIPYPTFVDTLATQKIISSRTYSLWLNDLDEASGTILFGGHDTEKYHGKLNMLPIQTDYYGHKIMSQTIAWTSITITDTYGTFTLNSSTASFPKRALLDSGHSLSKLPFEQYLQLSNYFGVYQDSSGFNAVPCTIADQPGALNFGLGFDDNNGPATVISVPFKQLAIPLVTKGATPPKFADGTPLCRFGLAPSDDGHTVFGDTFLRSAYVLYDLDNQQIGIAPTKFGSAGSNIVEIVTPKRYGGRKSVKFSGARKGAVTMTGVGYVVLLLVGMMFV